jgi:opacity protein-like surface antigen
MACSKPAIRRKALSWCQRVSVNHERGSVGRARRPDSARPAEIAPPTPLTATSPRVNAYHWNGNLMVRPFEVGKYQPYVTGGIGSFTADAVIRDETLGTTRFEDRRRATNLATNVGAGVMYRFNDWVGVGADYRTFFVHRDETTPHVNRFTAGLIFSLK